LLALKQVLLPHQLRRLAFALVWGQALAPAWGLMWVVLKRLG
jgi:hypothetical protein